MAAEFKIGIGADITNFLKGVDNVEKALKDFEKKFDGLVAIGDRISSIGQKMSVGLTLPIMALGAGALKAYGDIQALQKGLEAVMGSAGAASKEFDRLKEVAKLPGLGMEEAVRGSINLQAIGMDADKSRKILSQFGNAVASVGKGKAEFERAIYGVQQLANTDFPLGEDLNIIKDALPQVSNLLKEAFGTSRSDELAKMGVSSKQVLDTITAGLEKLPRVAGGINGAFENGLDFIKNAAARFGKIIDSAFDISGIITKVTDSLDVLISYFEGLSPAIQKTILVVTGLVAAAGPLLVVVGGIMSMLPTLIAGFAAVKFALVSLTGPIGLVTAGLIGIVTAVTSNWGKIKPYLDEIIARFRRLYEESFIVRAGVQALMMSFKTLVSVVGTSVGTIWQNWKTFGKGLLEMFSGISDAIEGTFTFDFNKVASGLSRGLKAVLETGVGVMGNNANALKIIGSEFKRNLSDTLNLKAEDIKLPSLGTSLEKEIDSQVNTAIDKVKSSEKKTIQLDDLVVLSNTKGKGLVDGLGNYFDSAYAFMNSQMANAQNIKDMPIVKFFDEMELKMIEKSANMRKTSDEFSEAFSKIVNQGIVDAVSESMQALGQAVANGENVLGALGKSLLSTFGSILGQLGQLMIEQGVALLAIKFAFESMNPYLVLAAGAALVALSSFISGSVSNLGSGMGASGGYSTSAGGASSSTPTYSTNYSSGGGSHNSEVVFRISGPDLIGAFNRNVVASDRVTSG